MNDSESGSALRKTRKADETRSRILEVALELFRQRGFEETTMRDIASACGIALGATYYYFGSKEAIVLAYYDVAKDQLRPLLEDAVENARGLAGGLRSLLQVKFDYFAPNRKFLGALFPHAGKLPNGRVRSYNASMNRATRAFDRTMQELMSTSDSVEFTIAMEVAGLGEPPESDEPTASVCAPVRLSHI